MRVARVVLEIQDRHARLAAERQPLPVAEAPELLVGDAVPFAEQAVPQLDEFQKRFDFPYICSTTSKSFLAAKRDTMRRLTMALIEATHFLKTRKEETKKFIAKYTRQSNPQYLEDSYIANVKLHDRVPLVTREGTEIQIKEALARKPGATLRVDDIVDDSIVRELEKSGFIDKVYK